jgi:uncharacterized repeat protein (TIGR03803 family)
VVLFSILGGGTYAGLTFDKAGNLYGTTSGGACPWVGGTVFQLKRGKGGEWSQNILHVFQNNGKDGDCPSAGVILDPEGNVYGTTLYGGAYDVGAVFKLTPGAKGEWTEGIMHSFDISDGAQPYAGLARDAAGNLYGTLAYGGRNGLGSVYKLIPRKSGSGPEWATEKILLNFSGQDGIYPFGGLILDTAGNLYGTTYYGGYLSDCDYSGCGVIFELTP